VVLWRISRHLDLKGVGGLRAAARWHFAGQPVVYLSETPSSALLEVCVHTAANDVPPEYTLLRVEGPDVEVTRLTASELAADWTMRDELTRGLGTAWLRKGETALLAVPSAIVPDTTNFLLNPLHATAREFRIAKSMSYPFDVRLKR
jgi:RES domain-containing protein